MAENKEELSNLIKSSIRNREQGNFENSISDAKRAVKLANSLKLPKEEAQSYENMSMSLFSQSDYSNSLLYAFNAVKIYEKINDERGLADTYNLLGVLYLYSFKDYKLALGNLQKAYKFFLKQENKKEIGRTLINIGQCYDALNQYENSITNLESALIILKDVNDSTSYAVCLESLGNVYLHQGNLIESEKFFESALTVFKLLKDDQGIISYNVNKGEVLFREGKFQEAEKYFKNITSDASPEVLKSDYEGLFKVYHGLNDYKNALKYHILFKSVNDSIFNSDKTNQMAGIAAGYIIDKKQNEITGLKTEKAQKEEIIKQGRRLQYSFAIGFALMIVLALVIFRSYKQKQKANTLLDIQKHEIELRNSEINQSITYAKRIQFALLPPVTEINKAFKDSFVLFLPKDIVSGDFYWFFETQLYYFIATADCTGHGVPGSLMSMLGSQMLNDAIAVSEQPNEILRLLNQGIKKALRQTTENDSTRDGMDIALCRIDKTHKNLCYAGANRPLVLIRSNEIIEYKPTKSAIGGLTSSEQLFRQENINLISGDCLYLFTDGFADQFGGLANMGNSINAVLMEGKKLKTKNLKDKLLAVNSESMLGQNAELSEYFNKWKGNLEQTDDVLMIGIRV
ncbi:MAG TPA: tetratricopeptide repeat protein [Bacteroidia bacterium]|nr:tetratricopeptide repeat protein [Bacteroidia bacterium]